MLSCGWLSRALRIVADCEACKVSLQGSQYCWQCLPGNYQDQPNQPWNSQRGYCKGALDSSPLRAALCLLSVVHRMLALVVRARVWCLHSALAAQSDVCAPQRVQRSPGGQGQRGGDRAPRSVRRTAQPWRQHAQRSWSKPKAVTTVCSHNHACTCLVIACCARCSLPKWEILATRELPSMCRSSCGDPLFAADLVRAARPT